MAINDFSHKGWAVYMLGYESADEAARYPNERYAYSAVEEHAMAMEDAGSFAGGEHPDRDDFVGVSLDDGQTVRIAVSTDWDPVFVTGVTRKGP